MQVIEFLKKVFIEYTAWAVGASLFAVVLILLIIALIKRGRARKRKRAEEGRRVQYTLPDSRNTYVRSRLNTALQVKEADAEEVEHALRLEYVRDLLYKLKNAPLSPAERLETDEMAGLLAVYAEKKSWSAWDLRVMNDCFARLLKLSAKYTI